MLTYISNKILVNSKIKKKLFHLGIIDQMLNLPELSPKEFKKQVSASANSIALGLQNTH